MNKVLEYRQEAMAWLEKATTESFNVERASFCAQMADMYLKMAAFELKIMEFDG